MGFRRNRRTPDQLNMLATKDNDGSTFNANLNHSAEAAEYILKPTASQLFQLARMIVHIYDNGLFPVSGYGAIATSLTNGIKMHYVRSGISHHLIPVLTPVHTNADWAGQCFNEEHSTYGAGNDAYLHYRWTFLKNGEPIQLDGRKGDQLVITLEDDFTGLLEHWFRIGGVFYNV